MDDIERILDIIFNGKISIKALADLEPAKKDIQALLDRYRHTPPNRTAATTEESAAITARIVELRGKGIREGGKTYQEIEKILWDEGIRGTKGQRLTAVAIRHRLDSARKNPRLSEEIRPRLANISDYNCTRPEQDGVSATTLTLSSTNWVTDEVISSDGYYSITKDVANPAFIARGHEQSPEEIDGLIFSLKDSGLGAKEIAAVLQEKHNLPVDWLFVRARLVARGRWGKAEAEEGAPVVLQSEGVADVAELRPYVDRSDATPAILKEPILTVEGKPPEEIDTIKSTIIGRESGNSKTKTPIKKSWVDSLCRQVDTSDIPVFLKGGMCGPKCDGTYDRREEFPLCMRR